MAIFTYLHKMLQNPVCNGLYMVYVNIECIGFYLVAFQKKQPPVFSTWTTSVSATISKRKNSLNKGISLNCDSEMLWGNTYISLVNDFPNEKLGGQN